MTPWVTRLLVANFLVFILIPMNTLPYLLMTLFPPAVVGMDTTYLAQMPFRPWTAFTYMFLHAGIWHLVFNMLGLFFFGPRLEQRLGARGFLTLYFGAGLLAAAFSLIFSWRSPVVGASGAVYGVLMGFAMFWPREPIYIYGILPIQARVLAILLVVFSLYSGVQGGGNTAHFAHLGGLVFGWGYLRVRRHKETAGRREFQKKLQDTPSARYGEKEVKRRWASIDVDSLHEINRDEVRVLLARVASEGVGDLSSDEKAFLDRMAGFFH